MEWKSSPATSLRVAGSKELKGSESNYDLCAGYHYQYLSYGAEAEDRNATFTVHHPKNKPPQVLWQLEIGGSNLGYCLVTIAIIKKADGT